MMIEIELWQGITVFLAFFSFVAGFCKVLLDLSEKRQTERFSAQDKAREEGQEGLRNTLAEHFAEERRNASALLVLERQFLEFKADLPIHYVRREDYIRGQSVIEAKLDALYNKLEVVQLKGVNNG